MSISTDRDSGRDMELTSLVLAASCWQCCTSGPNTVRNAAMSRASSETSSCSRSSRRSEEWVQCCLGGGVVAGMPLPLASKLARVETIWVMVTDSTVDSGDNSSRLPKQIPRSHGHGLLADGLGQHGARQVHGGHMVGQKTDDMMTLGGLPASLPSRLTESTVWSEDRIWLGLDS